MAPARLTPVVSGATVVFAGAAVGQVAGFVFNAVGAHALGPARYSTLAASVALLGLASPLFLAVQTVSSRETTSLAASGSLDSLPAMVRRYGARVVLGAAVVGAFVAVASKWVSGVFHLGSPWLVVIVGATIPGYMATHLLGGVLQGLERFHRFAFESVVEGSTKAVLGVLAVAVLFHSAVAAMVAVLCSCVLGLATYVVLTVPVLRRLHVAARIDGATVTVSRVARRMRSDSGILQYSMTALATYGLLAVMLSLDTLVAKHYLPGPVAGLYAGISLTGKIVYFATSALFVVVFPLFSRHHDQGVGSARSVLASGGVVVAVSSAIVALLALEPSWVVTPLLGERYRAANGYVSWMGVVFALYSLSYLLSTYLLARRRRVIIALLGATVSVQLTGFFIFHSSIADLMGVMAVSFSLLLVGSAVVAGVGHGRSAPSPRPLPNPPRGSGLGLASGWNDLVVAEVAGAVGPVPVLLAGSRALETAVESSDCDLSVVVPLWRTPWAVPRLGRVSERLSAALGVAVSVNPVPRYRLRHPAGSLFVDKLAAESVVLSAPDGWTLERRRPVSVRGFAASSALLSAVGELLRGFGPRAMREGDAPCAERSLRKAALLVAQVHLLRAGAYESRLGAAIEELRARGGGAGDLAERLESALAKTSAIDGFVGVRACVLDEIATAGGRALDVSRRAAVVRNVQYALIARLRGRVRWRCALRLHSTEADLADVQVLLLRALSPVSPGGVDDAALALALAAFPAGRRDAMDGWEGARDAALLEWGDAHPLVGLFA